MIGLVTQEGTYALLRGRLLCGVFQKVGSVGSSSGFGDGPLLQVQKVHRKLGSQNLPHRPSASIPSRDDLGMRPAFAGCLIRMV